MSELPPVIGLCGGIGAGKDTVAAALVEHLGYEQLSFAHTLKDAVASMFPWIPRCHFFGTQAEKAETLFTQGIHSWTGRKLLEVIGTDYMRAILPDIWVKAAMYEVDAYPEKLCVVSDVRFPNEAEAIRDRGGVVWRVTREGGPQETTGHASDMAWRKIPVDYELVAGDGEVPQLQARAIELAQRGGSSN